MRSKVPPFTALAPNLAINAMSVLSFAVPRKDTAYFFHLSKMGSTAGIGPSMS
jgi:hypothetical protein